MLKHFLLFISAALIAITSQAQNNAKVIFNNVPFTNGSEAGKTSFKSSEFIYARVELGKTVKEYFKIEEPAGPTKPHVLIFKYSKRYTEADGKTYADNFTNGEYLYVKPENLNKTYFELIFFLIRQLQKICFVWLAIFKEVNIPAPFTSFG